jgi:hypothetical protein
MEEPPNRRLQLVAFDASALFNDSAPTLASRPVICILLRPIWSYAMDIELKPGGEVRVLINKQITRAGARKTLERLFMMDKAFRKPIDVRSANFKDIPKRRGGCVWTKRTNKLHPELVKGAAATIRATPQHLRDLNSVKDFVDVSQA